MKKKLTPFSKLIIVALIVGGIFLLLKTIEKSNVLKVIETKTKSGTLLKTLNIGGKDDKVIRVGVVTWGGYAGGQYFNEGFAESEESRYFKDYGIKVKFVINDDSESARKAFVDGDIDVAEISVDTVAVELQKLKSVEPRVIFQSDWSRGGDAIVVRNGINSVNDLMGKKIAVALGSCSHTLLMWVLNSAGINYMDVNIVAVPSTSDATTAFIDGKVDAAVVWSPDDEKCKEKVAGSAVLISTAKASNIIADAFMAKKSYIDSHREQLKALVEGWMIGAAEINSSEDSKAKAAKILAKEFEESEEVTLKAINNTRLTTLGDNLNFFGLNDEYKGITGEEIYTKGAENFVKLNLAQTGFPPFSEISDSSIIKSINLSGDIHKEEGAVKYAAADAGIKSAKALSTKRISITFSSGSSKLDENAKTLIQFQIVDIARAFSNARIRIEGNTDSVGNESVNRTLSYKRAQAVADYLAEKYGFDKNRFVIVGNGADKPVADNSSEEGKAKNRRTDFQLLAGD